MQITKDTLIIDIIKDNFLSVFVLHKYGMDCCMCGGRYDETIERGAALHHVDVDLILEDLNKIAV